MPSEVTHRDQVQRRMLVALADSAPLTRGRPGPLAALAVFAVSGILTGAAVSATAAVMNAEQLNMSYQEPTTTMLSALVPGDTQLIGEPFSIEAGASPASLDVGPVPEGATELFISFGCIDVGTYTISIDGVVTSTYTCDRPRVASGGGRPVTDPGWHALRVAGEGRYVLWASWSTPAVPPLASAEQSAAIANGTVTEAEYREGFSRYQQCMADAGYSVGVADSAGPLISYSNSSAAVDSGSERACYVAEFESIEIAWQQLND
jgi:hypothetical protein